MRENPDHHDAELLLRLYDLRREEKLREAREWFMREFRAESFSDLLQRYPRGTPENARFRMVVSYWDMVASIVNHGLIKEEFFFENTGEFWFVWEKVKRAVPSARDAYKNPHSWSNLETLAGKFEKWMSTRAPEALQTLRQTVLNPPQDK